MKLEIRTICITLAAFSSVLWPTDARSDEESFCRDMPARRSVLDEGKQYLLQHPERRFPDSPARFMNESLEAYMARQRSDAEFKPISSFKIDQLALETPQQLIEAQGLAEKMECAQHFESAHHL
jgi:hypothetical protein